MIACGLKLGKSSLCPDLRCAYDEELVLCVRQNDRCDVSSVKDKGLVLCDLPLE